jgi:hypothetical protein
MMPTFQENQVVELREDVVEDGVTVACGAHGTIVDVYSKPREAYEVEFVNKDGDILAQLTLSPSQIRLHSLEKKAPA